jgi:hypothetical protein
MRMAIRPLDGRRLITQEAEDSTTVPVSSERVRNCLKSATFWVNELPRYADRQQQLADSWAIAAGILAALTSLAIFPVLTDTSTDLEKAIVSAIAFLAAICALIPRVRNYAELAGQARELSSRYGAIVGDLLDLATADAMPQAAARAIVDEFEGIKERKDALRALPDRIRVEIRRAELTQRAAMAEAKAADSLKLAIDAR